MADVVGVGIVKDIFKTGIAIKDTVDTFHQNKEDCRDLQVLVATVMDILSRLQEMTRLTSHPAMCPSALVGIQGSLDAALKLVTKWQKKHGLHRFLMARDMAKQLRRVQDDIQRNINIGHFAATMELRIELTRITTTTVR
ncbi:hypothetical protein PR202_ga22695 [Eleusine coracana subsp. coracana]|uniref:Mixed lineage kinase domain-containing protein n=1 Tax=Eleusine coracana subsp. coracana TaxID=191504 RepID=A0AAV5D394_ELECO|nr:hypothetical protein QOZ80_9AG0691970 [Eleusine coracana subsp. coracana]GJN05094.1 hypothetical protein PR202_ga22695 [Eleusine coracana subsp. coracana]